MQAIAGIPYYYRRFAYEMAVPMEKSRRIYVQDVPDKSSSPDKSGGPRGSYRLRIA